MKRRRSRPDDFESLTTAASKRSSWKMSAGTIFASLITRADDSPIASDDEEKPRSPYMDTVTPVSPHTWARSISMRLDGDLTALNTPSNCLKNVVHDRSKACAGPPSICDLSSIRIVPATCL
eukprot:scaffold116213_cov31-Tisochrysis_lutea.AAC.1